MTHLILPDDPVEALEAWDAYVEKIKKREPPKKPSILSSIKSILYKETYVLQVLSENFEHWKKEPFKDISNWDLILKQRCNRHNIGTTIRVIYECMEKCQNNTWKNEYWLRDQTKMLYSYQKSVILGEYSGPYYDIGHQLNLASPELIDIILGIRTAQLIDYLELLHIRINYKEIANNNFLKHIIKYVFSTRRLRNMLNTRDHNEIVQHYDYLYYRLADILENTNYIFTTQEEKITFYVSALALLDYMLECRIRKSSVKNNLIQNKNLVTAQFKNTCSQEYTKYATLKSLELGINFSTMLDSLLVKPEVYNETIEMPVFY